MLTAQLTEIRRDLAQFPSAALQRACTAVDDARTLPWPRQLQLRRRLMLACGTKCGELEPEAFDRLMRRLRDSSAARAARTDDVAYLLHISKAGGSSLCAAAIKDARLRTMGCTPGVRPRSLFCASGGRARWNSSASRQATRRGGTIGRTRPR